MRKDKLTLKKKLTKKEINHLKECKLTRIKFLALGLILVISNMFAFIFKLLSGISIEYRLLLDISIGLLLFLVFFFSLCISPMIKRRFENLNKINKSIYKKSKEIYKKSNSLEKLLIDLEGNNPENIFSYSVGWDILYWTKLSIYLQLGFIFTSIIVYSDYLIFKLIIYALFSISLLPILPLLISFFNYYLKKQMYNFK